jgi:hypothetical protein
MSVLKLLWHLRMRAFLARRHSLGDRCRCRTNIVANTLHHCASIAMPSSIIVKIFQRAGVRTRQEGRQWGGFLGFGLRGLLKSCESARHVMA